MRLLRISSRIRKDVEISGKTPSCGRGGGGRSGTNYNRLGPIPTVRSELQPERRPIPTTNETNSNSTKNETNSNHGWNLRKSSGSLRNLQYSSGFFRTPWDSFGIPDGSFGVPKISCGIPKDSVVNPSESQGNPLGIFGDPQGMLLNPSESPRNP